ncbi:MAG: hypothetical protein PVF83_07045 [Anaerolineales bacterium]|jgi:hypothetical protein
MDDPDVEEIKTILLKHEQYQFSDAELYQFHVLGASLMDPIFELIDASRPDDAEPTERNSALSEKSGQITAYFVRSSFILGLEYFDEITDNNLDLENYEDIPSQAVKLLGIIYKPMDNLFLELMNEVYDLGNKSKEEMQAMIDNCRQAAVGVQMNSFRLGVASGETNQG